MSAEHYFIYLTNITMILSNRDLYKNEKHSKPNIMKRKFKKLYAMTMLLSSFLWGALPMLVGATLLTSCEKLEELITGIGDEDDSEDEDGMGSDLEPSTPEEDTSDGEAPYFRFKTDTLYLPAWQDVQPSLEFESNIRDGYYTLESLKHYQDSAEFIQETPNYILRNPEDYFYGEQSSFYLEWYGNHTSQPLTDHLLVYQRRYYEAGDTLIARIPIVQEAGAYVIPEIISTDLSNVTLKLTPRNGAIGYSLFVSQDSIPLSALIREVNEGYDNYFNTTFPLSGDYTHTEENLQEATKHYVYIMAAHETYSRAGITMISFTTRMRNSDDDLVLEMNLNPVNNYTAYLPLEGQVKGIIDWGDGTSETVDGYIGTSGALNHHYENTTDVTSVQIRFRGTAERLSSVSTNYKDYICNSLTGIIQWGNTSLSSMNLSEVRTLKKLATDTRGALANLNNLDECFYKCTALETLPEGLFAYAGKVTSFSHTFYGCTALHSIPADLFAGAKDATSFYYTFYGCSALTSIPEDLFAENTKAHDMNVTFGGCTALESLPAGLFRNNTQLSSMKSTFAGCSSLTTLSEGLFAACRNITSLGELHYPGNNSASGIFSDCTALESIPDDLFSAMTKLKDAPGIFDGCTALTAIPESLFANNKELRTINFAFSGCRSLTSLPAGLFDQNRMLQSVSNAFSGCSSLTGESPYTLVNGQKVHLYERDSYPDYFLEITQRSNTFENCSHLSDYEQIPDMWK